MCLRSFFIDAGSVYCLHSLFFSFLAFFQNELLLSFSTMPSLISSWFILCSTLRADGLKFETLYDLGPNLCWTCMFAFYSIEI